MQVKNSKNLNTITGHATLKEKKMSTQFGQ